MRISVGGRLLDAQRVREKEEDQNMTRTYSDRRPEIMRLQGAILFPHDIQEESILDESGKARTVYSCILLRVKDKGQPIGKYEDFRTRHYAELRRQLYPPVEEQLDKIYTDGLESWKTEMISPVKIAVPKEAVTTEEPIVAVK
jgi:hypothetical protein